MNGPAGSGVLGVTLCPGGAGVFGANNAVAGNRGVGVQGNGPEAGVSGWSEGGVGVQALSGNVGLHAQAPIAARFTGDVEVEGDIKMVGEDFAEEFDVREPATEPGTVMVLDDEGGVG